MRELGEQFVLGRTIDGGGHARPADDDERLPLPADMLGEAARTEGRRAALLRAAYADAIAALGALDRRRTSASTPASRSSSRRCIRATSTRSARPCCGMMAERLLEAGARARAGMALNIDAEEADRLDLSLDVIAARARRRARSPAGTASALWCRPTASARGPVIDWLDALAETASTASMMVRLVKGAYWDTEIKRAQELGLAGLSRCSPARR